MTRKEIYIRKKYIYWASELTSTIRISKKTIATGILCMLVSALCAQVASEKYWIPFRDKNNSPYLVTKPSVYLSQRAIDRRTRQGIEITVQDFPVNPNYLSIIAEMDAVDIGLDSRWLNGVIVEINNIDMIDEIGKLPFVDQDNIRNIFRVMHSERSHKMDVENTSMSSPIPFKTNQTDNVDQVLNYGFSAAQNHMIHVDDLHNLGFRGQGMVIAVLDGGFKGADTTSALASLFESNRILGNWDFVTDQPIDFTQYESHGTYVLDCMGANVPDFYIGSAPEASYWLLRTEDAPTENRIEEYNWVVAAEFADSVGVDVINSSLGYTTFDDQSENHTYADLDGNTAVITVGADIAAAKGILVVNSAGNSGNTPWKYIGVPADGDSVLAIGAVRSDGGVASFSSLGLPDDPRVKPNVMALGEFVPMPIGTNRIIRINGTSFSSPILAGAAACLWQSRKSYGNMDIFNAIQESASRYSYPDNVYGYGIPNVSLSYYLITDIAQGENPDPVVRVFPNPTHDWLYIEAPILQYPMCRIMDLSGRLQWSGMAEWIDEKYRIDMAFLPTGMYFFEIIYPNSTHVIRVIKN